MTMRRFGATIALGIALMVAALAFVPLRAFAAVTDYTYEVIPVATDGKAGDPSYFGTVLYVKTDNPDPASFKVVDPESAYYDGELTFTAFTGNLPDVAYEDVQTRRVHGGYLFTCGSSLLDTYCKSDGGQMEIRPLTGGGEAANVTCPALESQASYLIKTYTTDSMTFFEKLDAVQKGLDSISMYPKNFEDPNNPNSTTPHPWLGISPHAELSLNRHYNVYNSVASPLAYAAHPYVVDSVYHPALMMEVAKTLEPTCVTSATGVHWMRTITFNGESRNYGGQGRGSLDDVYVDVMSRCYSFDGSSSDHAFTSTFNDMYNEIESYDSASAPRRSALYSQLSDETIARAVSPGSYVLCRREGTGTPMFSYVYSNATQTCDFTCAHTWVEGYYIDVNEVLHTGLTLEDHPTANILLRNFDYLDNKGVAYKGDLCFTHSSSTGTWTASGCYDPQNPSQMLALTKDDVEALFAQWKSEGKGVKLPDTGLIFSGSKAPGTPFTVNHVTGMSFAQDTYYMGKGSQTTPPNPTFAPKNPTDKTCTWTSSDPSVVAIEDITGYIRLTAKATGTCTITARANDGGYIASYTCSVVSKVPTDVDVQPSTLWLKYGKSDTATATVQPKDAIPDVTWTSDDESVATVDENGVITATTLFGSTRIWAKTVNGKTDSVHVKVGASISDVTFEVPDIVYGSGDEPTVTGHYFDYELKEGEDFVVTGVYMPGGYAGSGWVFVESKGKFGTGGRSIGFQVVPADISGDKVAAIPAQTYTGSQIRPTVTVMRNGSEISSAYYDVSYGENTNAGTGTVTITGKENYTGTLTAEFAILPASISSAKVTAAAQTYTGSALTPDPTVMLGGKTLAAGADYAVSYESNTAAGTATVKVTGRGNYAGTATGTFAIKPVQASSLLVAPIAPQEFAGQALEPKLTVRFGDRTLAEGTDYTVSYSENDAPGTGKAAIVCKGNFTGSMTVTFEITAPDEPDPPVPPEPELTITRIAGDYANETSAKISAEAFEASEWAVIARDDDFADALGAVGLAGALDAPIVLTDRFELSPAAAAEIQRLGAKHAYIIGGTGAIKEKVDEGLRALGVDVEPRVWGDASYDTSLECAKKIVELGGKQDEAVIAMSLNFQDALSISPYAYKFKVPVVLQTWGDTSADRGFTDEAAAWLQGRKVLVAGGAGAISNESVASYELVDRLWGESGYDTSNKIAEWMVERGYLEPESVVFACGAQAPKGTDALAGAALAGRLSAPILLASTNEAMEPADTTTVDGFYAASADKVLHTYVLGGAYVMPDALYQQIQSLNSAKDVSA